MTLAYLNSFITNCSLLFCLAEHTHICVIISHFVVIDLWYLLSWSQNKFVARLSVRVNHQYLLATSTWVVHTVEIFVHADESTLRAVTMLEILHWFKGHVTVYLFNTQHSGLAITIHVRVSTYCYDVYTHEFDLTCDLISTLIQEMDIYFACLVIVNNCPHVHWSAASTWL